MAHAYIESMYGLPLPGKIRTTGPSSTRTGALIMRLIKHAIPLSAIDRCTYSVIVQLTRYCSPTRMPCWVDFSGSLFRCDSHSILLPHCGVNVDACRRDKSLYQVGENFLNGKAICSLRGSRVG